jgi:hypothetical protein
VKSIPPRVNFEVGLNALNEMCNHFMQTWGTVFSHRRSSHMARTVVEEFQPVSFYKGTRQIDRPKMQTVYALDFPGVLHVRYNLIKKSSRPGISCAVVSDVPVPEILGKKLNFSVFHEKDRRSITALRYKLQGSA